MLLLVSIVFSFQLQSPKAMKSLMLKAGLLTCARFSAFPLHLVWNSGQIRKPFRRLQLRDSYGFSPYSLLIPGVAPGTKSVAKVIK